MTATTGNNRLAIVSRMAHLTSQAIELTVKNDGEDRDDEMVEHLMNALQLYKENRLGKVLPRNSSDVRTLTQEVIERRRAFRAKIELLGHEAVENQIYARLPVRSISYLRRYEYLYNLVQKREGEIRHIKLVGKLTLSLLKAALREEGLCLGMTQDEVKDCFGSDLPEYHPRHHDAFYSPFPRI
jgi:hypothetical protein